MAPPLPAHVDVLVVGAGPAGTAAGIRAAELGAATVVVEAARPGGVCTNTGCTPVRVLARTARLIRDARSAGTFGVELSLHGLDWPSTLARVDEVIEQVHDVKRESDRLTAAGATLVTGEGRATFVDPRTMVLQGSDRRIAADRIVLAVGGRSRRLPIPGAERAVLGEEVLSLPRLPERVVIIGSGSTGVQLATVFEAFGSAVTLVEAAEAIMPTADHDVSRILADAFVESGIDVRTSATVARIDAGPVAVVEDPDGRTEAIACDAVVMCAGWPAAVDGLGLDSAGVEVDGSSIRVDPYLRTSTPHIFSCGDANGEAMLVQAAEAEGRAAAVNAVLGPRRAARHGLLPWGGFTDPDIAGVGLTQRQAIERDPECRTAIVQHAELPRAVIDGRTVGMLKVISDRRADVILGAHAVGEQAVEIITALTTSMAADVRPAVLADVEYAYPTYTSAIGLACRRLVG